MRVKILIPWQISERLQVPLRDFDNNHVVVVDPISKVATPQFTTREYTTGDIIDLTDASAVLKAGLAVRVDENGNEILTTKPFVLGENKETKSGRLYYQAFCKKHVNDPTKIQEALKLEESLTLEKICQYALLGTASKIDGSGRRQYFLDHETQSFLSGFYESLRIEVGSLIDDKVSDLERRISRNVIEESV